MSAGIKIVRVSHASKISCIGIPGKSVDGSSAIFVSIEEEVNVNLSSIV